MAIWRALFSGFVGGVLLVCTAGGASGVTLPFRDDFENVAVGAYPGSNGWQMMFSGESAYVSDDVAYSGAHSFRLESQSGWARHDFVRLPEIPDRLTYEAWVWIDPAGRQEAALGFLTTRGAEGPSWNKVVLDASAGSVTFVGTDSTHVGACVSPAWYRVKVELDYATLTARVWLNGELAAEGLGIMPKEFDYPGHGHLILDAFGLIAGYGPGTTSVVYFDDVTIYDTATSAFDAYMDRLDVVQAPAPGTDLAADKRTAVRVFVKSHTPGAEGTVDVLLDIKDSSGNSILPGLLTKPFTLRVEYDGTQADAALFLFPGDAPGIGAGEYTFVATVRTLDGTYQSDPVETTCTFATTRGLNALVRRVAVGTTPAPTLAESAGLFSLLQRTYPIADRVHVPENTETDFDKLENEVDASNLVTKLWGHLLWYNLWNEPDADFVVGVLPDGALDFGNCDGGCIKRIPAVLVEAKSWDMRHVLMAAVAHEIGHEKGRPWRFDPGLGEEYMPVSQTDPYVLDCSRFEWTINPPPLHEDPTGGLYSCLGDASTRYSVNYKFWEPKGDIWGCYVEEHAFDPLYREERGSTLPPASPEHFVISFMGCSPGPMLEPYELNDRWVTQAVWDYLLLSLEQDALGGPSPAQGGPVLFVSGLVNPDASGELLPAYQFPSGEPTPSAPSGLCTVELVDSLGQSLETCAFDVSFTSALAPPGQPVASPFCVILPWHPEIACIVLSWLGTPIAERVVTTNAPTVQVVSPNGGETITGTHTIAWSATDADGDTLYASIFSSQDGGVSWSPVATDLTATEYDWDTTQHAGGESCLVKVMVSDGANTASDESDAIFSVARKSPTVSILRPNDGTEIPAGRALLLEGEAFDPEDGVLPSESLHWTSDPAGDLGTGSVLRVEQVPTGTHQITLTTCDSEGNPAADAIAVTIIQDTDMDGMPDAWEEQFDVVDPRVSDATEDPDEDYLRNEDEYLRGTDPGAPDTDGGGELDGLEALAGRGPLNPADDVPQSFSDVPPEFWAWKEIELISRVGVASGYDDGSYRPGVTVTRDQMAVYISRSLAGGEANVPDGPPEPAFADVPVDYWAYDHVAYAVSNGIVSGYDDGTYRPTATVDRGQMAVFVARGIVAPAGDAVIPTGPALPTFPDVPTDHWAYRYIEYIAQDGVAVTQGYDDATYRPDVVVTRDQMAVYVTKAFRLPM